MTSSVSLPAEVLQNIVSYLSHDSQPELRACSLVSRSWYPASVPFLYRNPHINGKNFDHFVRAICPSKNLHIRQNGLSELVQRLDMSELVHNGQKSLTARVLGRVKGNLEEFRAPQASFAVNSLAALSKCKELRLLDLSFVSESIPTAALLRTISTLDKLDTLHLPRSSTYDKTKELKMYDWPPKLRELHINGGIRDETGIYFSNLPSTLTSLLIGNCPHLSMLSIGPLLEAKGSQLRYLAITAPMPMLGESINYVLDHTPNLFRLRISFDLLSPEFFDAEMSRSDTWRVRVLDLDCFDQSISEFETSILWHAIDSGVFQNLRKVRLSKRLGWTDTERGKRGVREIDDLLKALAREDGSGAEIEEADAGVVLFGKR